MRFPPFVCQKATSNPNIFNNSPLLQSWLCAFLAGALHISSAQYLVLPPLSSSSWSCLLGGEAKRPNLTGDTSACNGTGETWPWLAAYLVAPCDSQLKWHYKSTGTVLQVAFLRWQSCVWLRKKVTTLPIWYVNHSRLQVSKVSVVFSIGRYGKCMYMYM